MEQRLPITLSPSETLSALDSLSSHHLFRGHKRTPWSGMRASCANSQGLHQRPRKGHDDLQVVDYLANRNVEQVLSGTGWRENGRVLYLPLSSPYESYFWPWNSSGWTQGKFSFLAIAACKAHKTRPLPTGRPSSVLIQHAVAPSYSLFVRRSPISTSHGLPKAYPEHPVAAEEP